MRQVLVVSLFAILLIWKLRWWEYKLNSVTSEAMKPPNSKVALSLCIVCYRIDMQAAIRPRLQG